MAKTNLSCKAAHALLRNYEELRPKRANTEEILHALGNNHRVIRDCEKDLANEIWETMISKIDIHPFFGVAVDAGVDEHVLVGVVYTLVQLHLPPPPTGLVFCSTLEMFGMGLFFDPIVSNPLSFSLERPFFPPRP